MKYLVLKKGWRWAAPVNASTPLTALAKYLKEPAEKWSDLPGEYTVFNDDETACWHFEYSRARSNRNNDVFRKLETVEHVPRVSTPSPQVSIDINGREYTPEAPVGSRTPADAPEALASRARPPERCTARVCAGCGRNAGGRSNGAIMAIVGAYWHRSCYAAASPEDRERARAEQAAHTRESRR